MVIPNTDALLYSETERMYSSMNINLTAVHQEHNFIWTFGLARFIIILHYPTT